VIKKRIKGERNSDMTKIISRNKLTGNILRHPNHVFERDSFPVDCTLPGPLLARQLKQFSNILAHVTCVREHGMGRAITWNGGLEAY
jgi:hypothetical protein